MRASTLTHVHCALETRAACTWPKEQERNRPSVDCLVPHCTVMLMFLANCTNTPVPGQRKMEAHWADAPQPPMRYPPHGRHRPCARVQSLMGWACRPSAEWHAGIPAYRRSPWPQCLDGRQSAANRGTIQAQLCCCKQLTPAPFAKHDAPTHMGSGMHRACATDPSKNQHIHRAQRTDHTTQSLICADKPLQQPMCRPQASHVHIPVSVCPFWAADLRWCKCSMVCGSRLPPYPLLGWSRVLRVPPSYPLCSVRVQVGLKELAHAKYGHAKCVHVQACLRACELDSRSLRMQSMCTPSACTCMRVYACLLPSDCVWMVTRMCLPLHVHTHLHALSYMHNTPTTNMQSIFNRMPQWRQFLEPLSEPTGFFAILLICSTKHSLVLFFLLVPPASGH